MSLEVDDYLSLVKDLIPLLYNKDPDENEELIKVILNKFDQLPDENKVTIIVAAVAFWDTDEDKKTIEKEVEQNSKDKEKTEDNKIPVKSITKNKNVTLSLFIMILLIVYLITSKGGITDFIDLLHNFPEIMKVILPPL